MKSKSSHLRYIVGCLVILIATVFHPLTSHCAQGSDAYSNATRLYLDGKYTDALQTAKEALSEAEKNHGTSSIELVKSLSLLADIQNSRKEYQDAARYLERLKTVQETSLGSNHRDVADTLSRMIRVYEKLGDTANANRLNDLAASRWGNGSTTKSARYHANTQSSKIRMNNSKETILRGYLGRTDGTATIRVFRSVDAYKGCSELLNKALATLDRALDTDLKDQSAVESANIAMKISDEQCKSLGAIDLRSGTNVLIHGYDPTAPPTNVVLITIAEGSYAGMEGLVPKGNVQLSR